MSASPPGPGAHEAPLSILQQALALCSELPGLVSDRVELLTLELKRAGRALALMLVLGVAATLLAMTAWGLLWALAVSLLVQSGMALWGALLVAVAVNAAATALLAWWLKTLLPRLDLPKTRRHLQFTVPPPTSTSVPAPPGARPFPDLPSGAPHEPQPAR